MAQDWIDGSARNQGLMITGGPAGSTVLLGGASLDITWTPKTGELGGYAFDSYRLTDRSTAKVNLANGNLLLENNDLAIAGTGLDLSAGRFYNSLEVGSTGNLGYGWRFGLSEDVQLSDCDSSTDHPECLLGPTGYRARFDKTSGGSYSAPPAVEKTLVHNGDGTWALTDHRSGEKWNFSNETTGIQTSVSDAHGNQISYHRDSAHNLDSITDTRGRTATVSSNSSGDVTSIVDSTSRSWSYSYQAGGTRRLASVTDPDSHTTAYGYDSSGRLNTITDARGATTTIGYDSSGRVGSVTRQIDSNSAHDLTTTYTYSGASSPCTQSGEAGKTVITDPRGKASTHCWDGRGRVVRVLDAAGYERSATYTPNGDANSFTDLTGTAAATSNLTFDLSGGTNNLSGGTAGAGETFSVGYCDPSASSGPTQCTTYAQNKYQPTSVTGPDQDRFFGYNNSGDMTSVKDSSTSPTNQATLGYDSHGMITSAMDGNSNTTTFGYDGSEQLTTITPPAATTNPIGTTAYTYDSLSRTLTVKDGRHATGTYEIADIDYDGLDRETKVWFGDGSWVQYTYDPNGNLTGRSDSGGNSTTYTYDRSNRRTAETFPGYSNTYSYDASGNLSTLTDGSGTVTYGYDDGQRVNLVTQPDSSQISVSYSGPTVRPRWTKLTFPGGTNQTTTTDDSGKPTSIIVKASGGATLHSLTYTYGTSSTARTQIQSVTDQAGNKTTYVYDSVGRLHQAETKTAGGTGTLVDRWIYTFDNASNRTKVEHTNSSGTTTTSYAYNSDNALCWSYAGTSTNGCGSPPTGAGTYASDASGNQTSGPSSFSAVYDVANRLTSFSGSGTLAYLSPTNTELVSIGSTTLRNTLLGVTSKTTSGSTTYYTRSPDGTLLAQRGTSGTQYVISDTLGSTRGLLTSSSSGIDRGYDYDPDGNATTSGSGASTDFKFASGQDIGGLYHFGARYYDPQVGRWTQPDPASDAPDFSYVGGDPINYRDPSGYIRVQVHPRFSAFPPFVLPPRVEVYFDKTETKALTQGGATALGLTGGGAAARVVLAAIGGSYIGDRLVEHGYCLEGVVDDGPPTITLYNC